MAGVTVSGVLWAIFQNNAGGAWDNAKKSFEAGVEIDGEMTYKGSDAHKAAVTGDTVVDHRIGGPALNILMKLMAILSVVFAPLFLSVNNGGGFISYLVPAPTTLLALGGEAAVQHQPSSFFAAVVFGAGMAVGMGGLFIGQRVRNPTAVAAPSALDKPLLVAKVEAGYQEGTALAGVRGSTYMGA